MKLLLLFQIYSLSLHKVMTFKILIQDGTKLKKAASEIPKENAQENVWMSEAWSKKHGRSDESEPGCVPGSEKLILCVDERDRACLQPTAGEGGSRISEEVSLDFLWTRRKLRFHEKKHKRNQNQKKETERQGRRETSKRSAYKLGRRNSRERCRPYDVADTKWRTSRRR